MDAIGGSLAMAPVTEPVSQSLEPMPQPESYIGAVAEYLRNGQPFEQTLVALTDAQETWTTSHGCEFSRLSSGFAPMSHLNCRDGLKGTWAVTVDGSIWPLQIGAEVSYEMQWKDGHNAVRKALRYCDVKEERRVIVPAGSYDSFHVVCEDPWKTRDWYVSPELGATVLYLETSKLEGELYRFELVSWNPGGAN